MNMQRHLNAVQVPCARAYRVPVLVEVSVPSSPEVFCLSVTKICVSIKGAKKLCEINSRHIMQTVVIGCERSAFTKWRMLFFREICQLLSDLSR